MSLEYELSFASVDFFPDEALPFDLEKLIGELGKGLNIDLTNSEPNRPAEDLYKEINRTLPLDYSEDFFLFSDYPGRNIGAIAAQDPGTPDPSPHRLRPGTFYYPHDMSRWSAFRAFATSSQVKAMLVATQGNSPQPFIMKSNPISPRHEDDDQASYNITTQLYMLSARPLRELGGTGFDGLYLVTLVDERFYFRRAQIPVSFHFHELTSWDSLITQIANTLGIVITYSPISSAYNFPEPDSQLWTNAEDTSALIDAIAYNIGRVVIRNLDGSYVLQSATEAIASVASNRLGVSNSIDRITRLAGGDLFYSGNLLPVGDLSAQKNAVVPSKIIVTYPYYVIGNDPVPHYLNSRYQPQRPGCWYEESYGSVYQSEVPITSGGILVSGLTGISPNTLHSTAKALISGEIQAASGMLPINFSGLNALTTQIATDFYAWKVGYALNEVYPGTYVWSPEGLHDIVWTYSEKLHVSSTKLVRSPWNQIIREMQQSHAPPDSNHTNIPKGVGGPSVPQTWRDNSLIGGSSVLSTDIGANNTSILVLDGSSYPQNNRWNGIINSGLADEEIMYCEGMAGTNVIGAVYRGIHSTIAQAHLAGAEVDQIVPNTGYGVNLVTVSSGLKGFPGAWTSGGIQEYVIYSTGGGSDGGITLTSGEFLFNYALKVFGGIDVQGGIVTTILPPPKITDITPTPGGPTTYTYGITTIFPNDLTTGIDVTVTTTNVYPLTTVVTNTITFLTTPGALRYPIVQYVPSPILTVGIVDLIPSTNPNDTPTATYTPHNDLPVPVTVTPTADPRVFRIVVAIPNVTGDPLRTPIQNVTSQVLTQGIVANNVNTNRLPTPVTAPSFTPLLPTPVAGPNNQSYSFAHLTNVATTAPSPPFVVPLLTPPSVANPIPIRAPIPSTFSFPTQASVQMGLWRLSPAAFPLTAPPGLIAVGTLIPGNDFIDFIDQGQPVQPGWPIIPPVANMTGLAVLAAAVGVSIVPLPMLLDAPTISAVGIVGGTTAYSYAIGVTDATGETISSPVGTALNDSTLDDDNYNVIEWAKQGIVGTTWQVYRTAGGATQGLIGEVTPSDVNFDPYFVDKGDTADPTKNPKNDNTTGRLKFQDEGFVSGYPISLIVPSGVQLTSGTWAASGLYTMVGQLASGQPIWPFPVPSPDGKSHYVMTSGFPLPLPSGAYVEISGNWPYPLVSGIYSGFFSYPYPINSGWVEIPAPTPAQSGLVLASYPDQSANPLLTQWGCLGVSTTVTVVTSVTCDASGLHVTTSDLEFGCGFLTAVT